MNRLLHATTRSRRTLSFLSCLTLLSFCASRSGAQAVPAAEPKKIAKGEDDPLTLDKFEVATNKVDGLNNKTIFDTSENSALHYDVITREDIDRWGITNMQELMRVMPQSTNYGYGMQNFPMVGLSTTVSGATLSQDSGGLRGFANSNTVILVNGRRINGPLALSAGTNAAGSTFGADISKIPVALIDRVEVLPASAGAIYGGGALGGVINVILRKNFDAKQVTTYFGTSTNGGATEIHVSAFDGFTLNQGRTSVTVSLDYVHRDALRAGQRDYLKRMIAKYSPTSTVIFPNTGLNGFQSYVLPVFAGNPGTVISYLGTPLGIPGNPTATFARVPAGLTDAQVRTLTPASFSATAGQYNQDSGVFDQSIIYTPNTTYTFQAQLEHQILKEDRLTLFAEAFATIDRVDFSQRQLTGSFFMQATDALNPFRTGVTPGYVGPQFLALYYSDSDLPLSRTKQTKDTARTTIGLKGKLGDKWNWTIDATGQYTRTFVYGGVGDQDIGFFISSAGPGTVIAAGWSPLTTTQSQRWSTIYNPFVDHAVNPVSASVIAANFGGYARIASDIIKTATLGGRAVGEAWQLPGGPILLSPGFELSAADEPGYQRQPFSEGSYTVLGRPRTQEIPVRTKNSLTTKAGFAEVIVPLIGEKFQPLRIHAWEINASKRFEEVNHGRAADTTTVSTRLAVTPGIAFRAALTEGFTQLALSNTLPSTVTLNASQTIRDPLRGNLSVSTVIPTLISGSNPDIKPQFARSKNFGVILLPKALKGVNVTVDYFDVHQFNTLSSPTLQAILLTPSDYPSDRIQRAPLTATDQAQGYTGGAIQVANTTVANVAQVYTTGVDLQIRWELPVPKEMGQIMVAGNATRTFHYYVQPLPSSVQSERVGIQSGNNPLQWKGNAGVYWRKGRYEVNVTGFYTDQFLTSTTAPSVVFPTANRADGENIPSVVTYDLQLAYKVPASMSARRLERWISGTKTTLGCKNLFDKEPPMVSDGTGFYSRYIDPRQQYVYVQIEKSL